jgi:hypothetical protein
MQGFEGPFRFNVDDQGTKCSWDDVPNQYTKELRKEGNYTKQNASIYFARIAVSPVESAPEKNNDWAQVRRVLVEASCADRKIKILSYAPGDRKVETNRQTQMEYGFSGGDDLFQLLPFKINLSRKTKHHATEQRFEVLTSCVNRTVQWVYSPAYVALQFPMYIYAVVPNDLDKSSRNMNVKVSPLRKGNKKINSASIFDKKVMLG